MIVDEFLKFNGTEEQEIEHGKNRLIETLERCGAIYGKIPVLMFCSDFMRTAEYQKVFEHIKEETRAKDLAEKILETVPESKRHVPSAIDYPLHEFACVNYLSQKGFSLKIGPQKERTYDKIIRTIGVDMEFAYLLDAYALGTKTADVVVHYIPTSRGPNNGQRIFFGDDERKVKKKLQQGCREALLYFAKIASVGGYLLQKGHASEDDLERMSERRLRKETIELVLENIVLPYQEVR